MTPAELAGIVDSVREFQLGESAQGRHFVRSAKAHAARTGDYEYIDAVRLLIAEEQRHARDLGKFLTLAGEPLAERTWDDTIFRWLRKLAGLEVCIAVLLTAEIIAKVYYAALGRATASPVLRKICAQILADENEHVRFQSERLAILRARRSRVAITLAQLLHRGMMAVALVVVWRKHSRALRAGGYSFRRFWRAAWEETRAALEIMNPARKVESRPLWGASGSPARRAGEQA